MGRRGNKLALVYEKGWSWGEGEGETSEDKCAVDMAPSLPSETFFFLFNGYKPREGRREADGCQTGPVNILFTRDRMLR